jgi:serine/threonine protein kinase
LWVGTSCKEDARVLNIKYTVGFVHDELVNDLLKECRRMSEFDHPNVLNLMGVCLDGGPAPFIIMPFMENGSLLSYLRKEKDTLVVKPDDTVVRE